MKMLHGICWSMFNKNILTTRCNIQYNVQGVNSPKR